MKITELTVEGLRGCPRPFALALNGKSLCLLGENGHAKTTLVDAAELWSTGDLAGFHREGCTLSAAIHLDAAGATVQISGKGFSHRRTLSSAGRPGELERLGPASETEVAPIPILRHSTIAEFIGYPAGEKKKALLELLGLGVLNALREPMKTTAGHVKRDAETAARLLAGERAAIELQLDGRSLTVYAEQQRIRAGLTEPVTDPTDLMTLELSAAPEPPPDLTTALDQLAGAIAAIGEDPAAAWNAHVADAASVRALGTAELLQAAQRVIAPEDECCPVCEQPVIGVQLLARLGERAGRLHEIGARIAEMQQLFADLDGRLAEIAGTLELLEAEGPAAGLTDLAALQSAARAIAYYRPTLHAARRERTSCPPIPDLAALAAALPSLREQALANTEGSQTQSLVALAELREKAVRLGRAERRHAAVEAAHAAVKRMLALGDEEIEQATRAAISKVSALACDYYARLVSSGPITDVALVYKPARAGQVEFSLTFDARHRDVTPPQRIMSTSQMNALGLALHLARLKFDPQPWQTVFLDDVVNSFDAAHRQGLARLLAEEFSDWQVIVLTHDRAFKDILRRAVKGWEFKDITAFSARAGPHLSDGDPRRALRDRLDDGATGMELAPLARRALEQALSTPLAKLGYEIRYDPDARYGAHDYLLALRRGLSRAKSPLKDLPVLRRMETDGYIVNLGVHERLDATALSTEDVYRLADDLDELDAALVCDSCGEPVWRQQRTSHAGESYRCGCGALAA
jgi:hypothetical protein